MRKVLFLVNHHVVIYNFRRELVERLLQEGFEVFISSPYGPRIDDLVKMGCKHVEASIERHGTSIKDDIKLYRYYKRIILDIQPDLVLTYTVKPNIYGNLACKKLRVPSIANVTGLGTAIESQGLVHKILVQLYRVAFKHPDCVFFQNEENERFFIDNRISMKQHKRIPGSGVNLVQHRFEQYPEDDDTVRFLFVGRIMQDKGIEELIEAAITIRKNYLNVQFDAIGFCEDDYKQKADEINKTGVIKFHGVKDDVHEYIKQCNAVVLPSYHEGMANVLLEAASTGRPVLASDIPGCKETFDEGVSGLSFQPRNSKQLIDVLISFIKLPYERRKLMGIAGRKKMEKEFDRNIVVNKYMEKIINIKGGNKV